MSPVANSSICTLLGNIRQTVVEETVIQHGKVNLAYKGCKENQNSHFCHHITFSKTEAKSLGIFGLFDSKLHENASISLEEDPAEIKKKMK